VSMLEATYTINATCDHDGCGERFDSDHVMPWIEDTTSLADLSELIAMAMSMEGWTFDQETSEVFCPTHKVQEA